MAGQRGTYNLLVEPWIPVLWIDGTQGRMSIRRALLDAGRIRQIAAPNPMDAAALLRFLLAVLQWCKPNLTTPDRERLERSSGIPREWLEHAFGDENRPNAAFNLLGDDARFYQDQTHSQSAPNRAVSDLFSYFPADTEINHFRHVRDDTVGLCLACCALGLIRLSACAMQGGQGKSPSINNAPPIYFLPVGDSLLETLQLNWPFQGGPDNDRPAWEKGKRSTGRIGVLEGFTWQPRSTWLGPLLNTSKRKCDRCGAVGQVVSKLVFKKGRSRKDEQREWRDPHVAWAPIETQPSEDRALRSPDPLKYPFREPSLWCATARALLLSAAADPPIPAVAAAILRLKQRPTLYVACLEPFTRQAKTFDEHCETWGISRAILQNESLRTRLVEEIGRVQDIDLRKYTVARSDAGKGAIRSLLAADMNRRLCARFSALLAELTQGNDPGPAEDRLICWRSDVNAILREAVGRACRLTTSGSRLQRRQAVEKTHHRLHQALNQAAVTDATAPPGTGRRKANRRRQ